MQKLRAVLELLTTFAILFACGVLIWNQWPAATGAGELKRPTVALPKDPISLDDAQIKGSRAARVALIVYSDFQCPFCGRWAKEILPELDANYIRTGKALVAFQHLPIESLHKQAFNAAVAAVCAGQQGKFWEMHDRLFADQKSLSDGLFSARGAALGLRGAEFDTCFKSAATAAHVRAAADGAAALGLSGTPAFFVGTVGSDRRVQVTGHIRGMKSLREFSAAIETALASSSSN